jgi:hypothetical protein
MLRHIVTEYLQWQHQGDLPLILLQHEVVERERNDVSSSLDQRVTQLNSTTKDMTHSRV